MKKIRRKFIFIAAAALLAVLSVVMFAFSITNYNRVKKISENTISYIMNEDRIIPGFEPNDRFRNNYVFVSFKDDEIISTDTSNATFVKESDAREVAEVVYALNIEKGLYQNYYFKKFVYGENTDLVILDRKQEISSLKSSIHGAFIIGGCVYVFTLVLIYFFSFIVIRPIEEANRSQKRFITDASHELKTPLTIIDSNISIIEMEQGKSEWTESVHKQVKRLSTMTNDLVVLSKLNEDDVRMAKDDIDISMALKEVVDTYSPLLFPEGISLEHSISENILIKGDYSYLNQLFSTLMDNLLKYASEGMANVSAHKLRNSVELTFSNRVEKGTKIDTKHIFDRFYKEDKSRNSKGNSFGIGLSMAKAIVELHKGKISASLDNDVFSIKISFPII